MREGESAIIVHARCPYCGEENLVGPLQEKRPNEPLAMMQACSHVVFVATTNSPAAEYSHKELFVEFGQTPGAYGLETALMKILNSHFAFVGPVAFAPSEKERMAARKEVADFLRAGRFDSLGGVQND